MAGWLASGFTLRMRGSSHSSSCNPAGAWRLITCAIFLAGAAASWCSAQDQSVEQFADRGFQAANAGDVKTAERELRRAVSLSPNNAAFLAALGNVLAR